MSELITLTFSKNELQKILAMLQHSISQELEIMQENDNAPDGETFVLFLESVQEQTDIYIKLSEAIAGDEGGAE